MEVIFDTPTPHHFLFRCFQVLEQSGYVELKENEEWKVIPQRFFINRKNIGMVIFNLTGGEDLRLAYSKIDFPNLKIPNYGMKCKKSAYPTQTDYQQMSNREVRIAGVIVLNENGTRKSVLINDHNVFLYNGPKLEIEDVFRILLENLNYSIDSIVDYELWFVDSNQPTIFGDKNGRFVNHVSTNSIISNILLNSFIDTLEKQTHNSAISFLFGQNENIDSYHSIFIRTVVEKLMSKKSLGKMIFAIGIGHVFGCDCLNRDAWLSSTNKKTMIICTQQSVPCQLSHFLEQKTIDVGEKNGIRRNMASDEEQTQLRSSIPDLIFDFPFSSILLGLHVEGLPKINELLSLDDLEGIQQLVINYFTKCHL